MTPATEMPTPPRMTHAVRLACATCAGIGFAALVGWATGVGPLTHVLPGYPAMNPLSAVCVVLASLSLSLLAAPEPRTLERWLARASAGAVLVFASLRVLELQLGLDLPLDDVLFGARVLASAEPARMGVHTAFSHACLASALLTLPGASRRSLRLADALLFAAVGLSLAALIGYLYAATPMHGLMAIQTAISVLVLAVAGFLVHPGRGLPGLLLSRSPGGLMARRVLPVAALLPIALGWLRLAGQRAGMFGLEIGTAMLVLAIVTVMVGIIWLTGHRLDAAERERERVERALRQSLERQSRILDANLIGILTADRDARIVDANATFLGMLGYSREDLPLPSDAITPPEWRERTSQARREFQERGVASPFEKEYLRKDGTRVPVLVGAAALPDAPEQALAFVVDLSAERRAQVELRRLQIFLDSIIENLPNMVFVKDAKDLRFVRFNRAGEELLGFRREDLIGKNDYDFFPRAEADFFTAKDRAVLASGSLLDIPEEPIQTLKQGERLLHTQKVAILDENGAPAYLLGISEDITDRKRAERQLAALNDALQRHTAELERANGELESFSYSVSHDLRAPLRHIDGFTDLLVRHATDQLDEKGKRYLQTISASAKSMGRLIDDLLAFSRMSRAHLQSERVDLGALVREIRGQLERDTNGRRIEWRVGQLPAVTGDVALMRQMFTNLLANAVKYTAKRDEAVIEIGAEPRESEEVVWVRDNGVGFDMKYEHKLYGVFQRLHRDDEFEGTGIGLATVRRIADRHGGRTWAEGAVGRGATFYVALPRRVEAADKREAA